MAFDLSSPFTDWKDDTLFLSLWNTELPTRHSAPRCKVPQPQAPRVDYEHFTTNENQQLDHVGFHITTTFFPDFPRHGIIDDTNDESRSYQAIPSMYLPTYETFTSELHPRNDDDLELAPAELDGVTTMYSVCAPRARMLGAEAQAQA